MRNWKDKPPVPVHGGYNIQGGETPYSWFEHWGCGVTADHVIQELGGRSPTRDSRIQALGPQIDAALFGDPRMPRSRPRLPVEGEEIVLWGHPAGASQLERRIGKVYFQRTTTAGNYHSPTCIGIMGKAHPPFDPDKASDFWPVDRGFSGGLVAAKDGPLGIIVGKNNPTDLDGDNVPETSFEFVPLALVWDVVSQGRKVA